MLACKVSLAFRFNQSSKVAVQSIGNITERLPVGVAVNQTQRYRNLLCLKTLNMKGTVSVCEQQAAAIYIHCEAVWVSSRIRNK